MTKATLSLRLESLILSNIRNICTDQDNKLDQTSNYRWLVATTIIINLKDFVFNVHFLHTHKKTSTKQ